MKEPSIVLRAASEADLPTIGELAGKIWRAWYPQIISMEQVEYMLQRMYSPHSLAEQMQRRHAFHLLFVDGQAAGYCSVSADSEQGEGAFFLHKFYVDTALHRQGLGAQMLAYLLQTYQPQALRLTVNRVNYTAINFYFRNGFTIERVADFDIGGGYFMNDFVMLRKG